MGKRILSLVLVSVFILLIFSGCGSDDDFNIAYPVCENVRTLDPQFNTSSTGDIIIANCFEGLISVDQNGNYIPAAAESWENTGLTYRFNLRQNAKWKISQTAQEGMSGKIGDNYAPMVTANDFVFAFRRLADPNTKAPLAYKYKSIAGFADALDGKIPAQNIGVKALSDFVLEITLAYDDTEFFNKLLLSAAMPCNQQFFAACNGRYGLMTKYILTNGPFYFTRWNTDSNFRISRNPDYSGERKAKPNSVWFYLNDDLSVMNAKLQKDTYTLGFTNITGFDASQIDKNYTVVDKENIMTSLIFNCSKNPTSVKSIRTALLLSLKTENFESSENELQRQCMPVYLLSNSNNGINADIAPEYNESAAKASLSAGLTELQLEIAEMTVLCTPEFESILKNQMQTWQKVLGVSANIKIQSLTENELIKAVQDGDFDAALYPLKASSVFASDFFEMFRSSSVNNITYFSSPDYDALFEKISIAKNDAEKAVAYNDALKFLMDNGVYYPLYKGSTYFVCRKDVSGTYGYGCDNLIYFADAVKN